SPRRPRAACSSGGRARTATLAHAPAMRGKRVQNRFDAGGAARGGTKGGLVAVQTKGAPRGADLAAAEQRRRSGPRSAVAVSSLGAQMRAERDQLGQLADRLDVAERGDPHEAVRVKVVAEQQRDVLIR